MKRSNLSNLIGASAIGLSLAILPLSLPVSAQTDAISALNVAFSDHPLPPSSNGADNIMLGDTDQLRQASSSPSLLDIVVFVVIGGLAQLDQGTYLC